MLIFAHLPPTDSELWSITATKQSRRCSEPLPCWFWKESWSRWFVCLLSVLCWLVVRVHQTTGSVCSALPAGWSPSIKEVDIDWFTQRIPNPEFSPGVWVWRMVLMHHMVGIDIRVPHLQTAWAALPTATAVFAACRHTMARRTPVTAWMGNDSSHSQRKRAAATTEKFRILWIQTPVQFAVVE